MESLPSHINPERRRDFNFDLNAIFPNFMIHVRPGEYFTHQFWPLSPEGPHRSGEGRDYLPRARNAGERFSQEYSHLMRRNAWLEDTSTMEATFAGLTSGVLKNFMLSDPEILIRHSYKVLEDHAAFTGTALRGRRTLPAASLPPSFADLEPYFAGRCRRRRHAASCDATAECPISPNSTRRCCLDCLRSCRISTSSRWMPCRMRK